MKKICLILVIMLITVTIGCNRNQDNSNTIVDNEDVIGIEGEADKISEIDNTEIDFEFNENTVANLQQVATEFDWSKISNLTYEYEIKNLSTYDTIPQEVYDVLISVNDGNAKDNLIQSYLSKNYVSVNPEDMDTTPYLGDLWVSDIKEADIDYDGENEYLIRHAEGNKYSALSIVESVNGEMQVTYYISLEYGYYELLEIEGRYYILADEEVVYYDSEIGEWNSIKISRVTMGYKAHQCYGNIETEDDLFLQDIDLLDKKDWAKQSSYTYEFISGEPLIKEREINDRIYYYVFTDFREHDLCNKTDRLLFVVKCEDESYEIVKAYYLAADVKIRID